MIQQHGGNIEQLGGIIDFSANINPLGIPDGVRRAVAESVDSIEKYPDPYCTELRMNLAGHEHISAGCIVCGNGADDLIFRIVHAFRPARALICAPTFSEYSRALSEVGCEITEHLLTEENGFGLTENILPKLDSSVDICFICTPNNPTGRLTAPDLLKKIAEKCMENETILVCDECFLDFVSGGESFSIRRFLNENCIILKAFTKLYAMPGIRLGYAICGSSRLSERIKESGQFWSVSAIAQKAGIAALAEGEYLAKTVELITRERSFLARELSSAGAKVFEGAANYLLFKSRSGLGEALLSEGILIRDCQSFHGLSDGFFRTAVRTHNENIRLVSAVRRCLNG